MAIDSPAESADPRASDSRLLLSRQPVIDGRDRVAGYRIAYAMLGEDGPVTPSAAEANEMMDEVLSVISGDEQVQGSMAHLPVTREMLIERGIPNVRRDLALLRIRYEDAVDPAVREILTQAAAQGYALELDALPGPDVDPSLLGLFTAVEFDLADWEPEALSTTLAPVFERDGIALAINVPDHVQREHARALGFEWFTGRFFETPNLVIGKSAPIGDLRTLVELTRLQGKDARLDELVPLIERDLGLGVRLLRYINSAYFGLSGRVRSISHAASMLGPHGLSRWALIVATLGGAEEIPRELQLLALTRARTLELVGCEMGDRIASDELFTIGLLSTVDAMFRIPIEQVLSELPLTREVCEALSEYAGAPGELLGSLVSYERGDFRDPALLTDLMTYATAYRSGLEWAREALGGFV
jgi:EAL and modified HD-GYP domain-containing signal transduction protein